MVNLKLILVSLTTLFLFIKISDAQNAASGEIGISTGVSYYLGELNTQPFTNSHLSFGAFYKHNINKRYAIKGALNYGKISGSANNLAYTQINPSVVTDFNRSFYDVNSILEFNFMPFLAADRKFTYTPYVFAGMGLMYYPSGESKFIFNIPFGFGVKYNVFKNFILGADFSLKKTFNDNLDYNYLPPSETNVFKQFGYAGNKDWYSICGIYLSYKIKYRVKCPAFD